MIFPLILLALGIAAVATYEFSPKAHEWVDAHVQAVKDSLAAHDAASANLDAAHATLAQTQSATSSATPTPQPAASYVTAAATHVATAAEKAAVAKKAATELGAAMGDHPAAAAAHRVADLVAALTAAKADETEATYTLMVLQGSRHGSSPQAQLLRQQIASAQTREAVLRDQLAMIGQRAGAALREGLASSSAAAARPPARDPWG